MSLNTTFSMKYLHSGFNSLTISHSLIVCLKVLPLGPSNPGLGSPIGLLPLKSGSSRFRLKSSHSGPPQNKVILPNASNVSLVSSNTSVHSLYTSISTSRLASTALLIILAVPSISIATSKSNSLSRPAFLSAIITQLIPSKVDTITDLPLGIFCG